MATNLCAIKQRQHSKHKYYYTSLQLLIMSILFVFSNMSVTTAQTVPELIYFKFNSATSGSVVNEAQTGTRVSTTGTLNGATIGGAGQFGAALQGTGTTTPSNNINANWPLSLSGAWTISLWMKGFTSTLSSNYIFGGSGGSSFRAMTGTGLVSGGGNILVRGTGLTDIPVTGCFNAAGDPVVVHIVYNPTVPDTKVYINGVYASSVAQSGTLTLTGTDFTVGGYGTSNGIPSGSLVDEFRLYNRALTASEISTTWNVDLNGGPPCTPVAGITVNSLNSTSMDFSWSAVTGSQGYEYAVDQNASGPLAAPTPTSLTTGSVNGLQPGTQYYIHVRNKCAGGGISVWTTHAVQTLPPCITPIGFTPAFITDDSISFIWTALTTGTDYQYIVNKDFNDPASGSTGITTTVNNAGYASGLTEGNLYYVHIRSRCPGNDSSGWSLDSFYTPITCRDANVRFTDINTNRCVAYWDDVVTAVSYEYALTKTQAPPASGTSTINKSVLLSFLDEGTPHYFHIKTYCSYKTVNTNTEWKTYEFSTWTLGINSTKGNTEAFSVYPNPATDKLQLKVNRKSFTGGTVTITGINGMLMEQLKITEQVSAIDISNYASGMYLIKYSDDSGTYITRVTKE